MQNDLPEQERTIALLIEYEGTPYAGWQRQEGQPSVQATIEEAIKKISGETLRLQVAGRTDAGVHAQGQVASFRTKYFLSAERFASALNRYLPSSISIHQSIEMPYAFNARLDSIAKRYRYCIYQGPQRSALHQPYFWWIKNKLNVEAMQRAAQFLVGEHDFESFRSAHCDAEHATRYIHSINVTERHYAKASKEIFIDVYGNAFCRHMVRILSGTLAEVGKGLREAENIQEILRVKDRTRAGVTAPSCGLTLLEVEYPQDIWI